MITKDLIKSLFVLFLLLFFLQMSSILQLLL